MLTIEEKRAKRNAYMRDWKRKNAEKVNAINLRVKDKNRDLYRRINRESIARMRAEDPQRFKEINNRSRKKHQTKRQAGTLRWVHGKPGYYIWKNAQYRASREGLAFNLRREDIEIPAVCPVLGIQIIASAGRHGLSPCSPSLDKILPALGYVVGNVRVISNLANILKRSEISPGNLRKVADYIEREVARVERELAG